MVKDLRSEFEVGNVAAVLDGADALDKLMESVLRWKRTSDAT
jgi:protein subunit release factor B